MSNLKEIEYTIEVLKQRQIKARKFEKLMSNREFKELILTDYLQDEPVRLTSMLVHPQHREGAVSQLMGIARFNEHINYMQSLFVQVDKDLQDAEEMRDQLLAEE